MNFDNYFLRLMQKNDAFDFFDLIDRNRPRLEAFFSGTVARTKTLQDTKEYLEEMMKRIEKKNHLPFLLTNKDDGSLVGYIDLKNIDWNIPKGELGYFIDKKYANQGLGTKMLQAFINYCFSNYGFQKLFIRTHEANHSARKIAEHCGFEIEGKLRNDYRTTSGELVDLLYYGLIVDSLIG